MLESKGMGTNNAPADHLPAQQSSWNRIARTILFFLKKTSFKLLMLVFPPALLPYKKNGATSISIRTIAMLLTVAAYVMLILLTAHPQGVMDILRTIGIGLGLSALASAMSGLLSGRLDIKALSESTKKPSFKKKLGVTFGFLTLGLLPTLEVFSTLASPTCPLELKILATNILSLPPGAIIAIPLVIIAIATLMTFSSNMHKAQKQLGITQGRKLSTVDTVLRAIFGTDPSLRRQEHPFPGGHSSYSQCAASLKSHADDTPRSDHNDNDEDADDVAPIGESLALMNPPPLPIRAASAPVSRAESRDPTPRGSMLAPPSRRESTAHSHSSAPPTVTRRSFAAETAAEERDSDTAKQQPGW